MTIHTIHPDPHTHGLADGCPRCDQLAEHPFEGLDDRNLQELIRQVQTDAWPRSDAEALAMSHVRGVMRLAARLDRLQA